jgi:endoplasmic reticulum Man9GlcNAc2 1,2-alpha-mannosidase
MCCYRLQAWAIFRAFEKHCRVDSGGYAGLESVLGEAPLKRRDHMESFWLSESLKYLWLLFSDDGADLRLPAL